MERGLATGYQSIVGGTDDGGGRRVVRGRGMTGVGRGIGRSVLGSQAGAIIARLDSNRTTPTLLIILIHYGDHDLSSGSDGDFWPLECVGIDVTEVDEGIPAGVVRRNNDDIVRVSGAIPAERRGLALGKFDGVDREVSLNTENSESENESSGEKSEVHRRDTF